MTDVKVAIIGATGAVGREMIEDLVETTSLSASSIGLFASPRSRGQVLYVRGEAKSVQVFSPEAVGGYPVALMSAGGAFSKDFSPVLAAQGMIVIDNSSAFRKDPAVPLVVPEVNPEVLKHWDGSKGGIIANPNCSTIQLVVALKPLQDAFGIDQVHVSTYQAVSGAGQAGIRELAAQTEASMRFEEAPVHTFPQPISYNLIPCVGSLDTDGHCEEELKMVYETKRILGRGDDLSVLVTTVRVPVFNGHSESVNIALKHPASLGDLADVLSKAPGVIFHHHSTPPNHIPTPKLVSGQRGVFVARLRAPTGALSHGLKTHWIQLWCVADNLKKGAATNAVQILELLHLSKRKTHHA